MVKKRDAWHMKPMCGEKGISKLPCDLVTHDSKVHITAQTNISVCALGLFQGYLAKSNTA